jgi:catechol 2,3-dioxygenase-like lactoylglutathione lyase family enzyme
MSSGSSTSGANLPIAILETCLNVADVARAREFYTALFECEVMKSDDRFCAMRFGEQQILILFRRGSDPDGTSLPFGRIPAHGSSGQGHVGFAIPAESLSAWRKRLVQRGIAEESTFTWPGGGVSVYFRDLDDHLLELLTPGVWPIY